MDFGPISMDFKKPNACPDFPFMSQGGLNSFGWQTVSGFLEKEGGGIRAR